MIVLTIVLGVNRVEVEPVKANNDMPNLAVLAQVAEALDPTEDKFTADLVEPATDANVQIQEVDSEPAVTNAQTADTIGSITVSRNQTPQSTSLSRKEVIATPIPEPSEHSEYDKATAIINTAKQYLGVNYVWGGSSSAGFDCSGLVQYVFAQNGVTLPRVSCDQYTVGNHVDSVDLQPADLVFFTLNGDKVVNHVGIYIGDGLFINASSSIGVVVISDFSSYWTSYYTGAKRVL